MAVLGNLRKNSFVLIAVIGMALFAFVIAGVFDGSGFQSQEPVGKVNGEELSITDFRNQLDVLKKSYNFNDLQALTTAWDESVRLLILTWPMCAGSNVPPRMPILFLFSNLAWTIYFVFVTYKLV